ncbi:MAG: arsenite oxidase large subunit, partial [Rhodospirillaceae bacterium]|nr:arsenite oxidase large subunit [Rhodospirillaceae bacterium]
MSHEPYYEPLQNIPLPPKNATVLTTACDYCIVACGYKVYRWPVDGKDGGVKASQNALNRDFPIGMTQGNWVSPNMYNRVMHDGKEHHILIVPDADTKVVNIGGDHSVRGGAIAQKCYSERTATHDRLKTPLLRVNRRLVPISWDEATDIFA